jgi:PBP1b-binding outer membrane lipoprotein LpoB
MKRYLSLLFVILLLTGCSRSPAQKDILAKVNNYEITRSEFEDEFKVSPYGKTDTPASRKEFLDTLIDRKLILQYAEQKGYDKEKGFLKLIERFWEQSLLKVALDKKTR